MTAPTWREPPDFADSTLHGPDSGAELFVVEGRSAAAAVRAVRDPRRQAVLALRGMPLNAARASAARLAADPFLGTLVGALGAGDGAHCTVARLRYERVLLLHDPDADGIHIGALLLIHAALRLLPLLAAGRIERVHAPVGEVRCAPHAPPEVALGHAHLHALCARARAEHGPAFVAIRYRGLASLGPAVLRARCVDPATRLTSVLTEDDASRALAVFGGVCSVAPGRCLDPPAPARCPPHPTPPKARSVPTACGATTAGPPV
jgi:DNA gyrase subunit B